MGIEGSTCNCSSYTITFTVGYFDGSTSCSCTTTGPLCVVLPPPRHLIVEGPKHWKRETHLAWAELINRKTKTGFIVKAVIFNGEVVITDPTVERRTFDAFLPLLLWRATDEDTALIEQFIDDHAAETP